MPALHDNIDFIEGEDYVVVHGSGTSESYAFVTIKGLEKTMKKMLISGKKLKLLTRHGLIFNRKKKWK